MRVHTLDLYRNAEEFETKFIDVMRYSPVTASTSQTMLLYLSS